MPRHIQLRKRLSYSRLSVKGQCRRRPVANLQRIKLSWFAMLWSQIDHQLMSGEPTTDTRGHTPSLFVFPGIFHAFRFVVFLTDVTCLKILVSVLSKQEISLMFRMILKNYLKRGTYEPLSTNIFQFVSQWSWHHSLKLLCFSIFFFCEKRCRLLNYSLPWYEWD